MGNLVKQELLLDEEISIGLKTNSIELSNDLKCDIINLINDITSKVLSALNQNPDIRYLPNIIKEFGIEFQKKLLEIFLKGGIDSQEIQGKIWSIILPIYNKNLKLEIMNFTKSYSDKKILN